MAQPHLIQIALDSGGHNAIGVDQEGGVWRGRIQRATSGEEFIVGSASAPSSRRVDPRDRYPMIRLASRLVAAPCRLPLTDVDGLFRVGAQSLHDLEPQLMTSRMEVDLPSLCSCKIE